MGHGLPLLPQVQDRHGHSQPDEGRGLEVPPGSPPKPLPLLFTLSQVREAEAASREEQELRAAEEASLAEEAARLQQEELIWLQVLVSD